MFQFLTLNINNKKYFIKENDNKRAPIAVLHKGKYRISINLPDLKSTQTPEMPKTAVKQDIEQMGYMTNENSFLQVVNSDVRIDNAFLLQGNSYVQDIDIAKNIAYYGSDKQKGLIIFENNKEFQKFFKDNKIDFEFYSDKRLKVNFGDLDENIIMDVLSLSNNEKSALSSIMYFKEVNKDNEDIGISVLDGSNWMMDLINHGEKHLAKQFNVDEYKLTALKTSMVRLKNKPFMSTEHSNINEIIKSAENGKIILLEVSDENKKLVKSALSKKAMNNIRIIDNMYHKLSNVEYVLYSAFLFDSSVKDFTSFVINRHSFSLKNELADIKYFEDEFMYLDLEYLVVKRGNIPLIATNEDYIKNKILTKIETSATSYDGFW